jgi:PqqD family protein of HPr-rel-A system
MTPAPRWRAASPEELLWSEWDAEYVLYHRPSGKTHFLNESAWFLLSEILREPLDVAATADELARLRGVAADQDLHTYVSTLVLRFEELGLVHRA